MRFRWLLILCLGLLVVSCEDKPAQDEVMKSNIERDEDLIGLTLSEAEKLAIERGLIYRVTMLDGKHQPATRDLRQNRVNFVVEKGKVMGVSRG